MTFTYTPETPLAACWLTAAHANMIELIQGAAAARFSAIGIKVLEPGQPDTTLIGANGESAASVRRAASQEGVEIFRTTGFWLDGRYSPERYYPFLAASAELGATYIGSIGLDTDQQRLSDNFGDLCQRAAEFGLYTTIEFAPFSTVRTIEDAHSLIVRTGHENASILLDSLHLYRSGGTAKDIGNIPSSLIKVVQLCDARTPPPAAEDLFREALSDRLDPGEGTLPLLSFMDALPPESILEIEVPCYAQRTLTPAERLRRAADAARAFLELAAHTDSPMEAI